MIEKYLRKKITRKDLETRILSTSLQSRYAKLGGLSEVIKLQMRQQDSILKVKSGVVKTTKDTIKKNK
jgi:penicillin-binding protein 2